MKTGIENLYNLFELSMDFMIASSGDGTSLIICDDPFDFADIFEKWLSSYQLERIDYLDKNTVVFQGKPEEAIIFKDKFEPTDYDMYEFIAILPSWYSEFIR